MPSRTRGYLLCSCCNCIVSRTLKARGYLLCSCCNYRNSSAPKSKRLPSMQPFLLLGGQCSQQLEVFSMHPLLLLQLLEEQCNQQPVILSGAVVTTARIAVPSRTKGSLRECRESSEINNQRFYLVRQLHLSGKQCPQQPKAAFFKAFATAN